ncbi:MAG: hypothetical protein CVU39_20230 [Chloroflexi bacterium HGW-Chloroflexi-10]|nr:MAG: hypothetical protein CVU39_20230 [Chloroflexi bacterium HGW-Chloroflexi-10]
MREKDKRISKTEIKEFIADMQYDFPFAKPLPLQPKWIPALKVTLVLFCILDYWYWFGLAKTVAALLIFVVLSLLVHLHYRTKTKGFQQNWRDFAVLVRRNGQKEKKVGLFYYVGITLSLLVAMVVSQLLL